MKKNSLKFKLIFLFTLLMVVNVGVITLFLYQTLKNEMVSRDNTLLVNRADQLAKLIMSGIDIKTLPIYFQRMMDMKQDIIYIADIKNNVLVDTNRDILFSDHLKTVNVSDIDLAAITHWETAEGVPVSAISFMINSPSESLNVVLAKASIERYSVLSEYLNMSFAISVFTILCMAFISAALVKRGLRDIYHLSRVTEQTDIHTLSQQINIERLPEELKSLGNSMNIMRCRLKSDFIKLTQLADDLAHELRTPINAIKVQNEITLQRTRTLDEYQSTIVSNIEELDTLSKLIENTLFIARAENKNIALNKEYLLVDKIIDDVYGFFAFYAEENQVKLIYHPSSIEVHADAVLLIRIVMNLISNAIKYSYPASEIVTNTLIENNNVVVRVSNHGDLIAKNNQVFDRFWRGDNARTSEGSGLGLSIVQAIMILHGGTVTFERIDNQNVCSLYFPIESMPT